MFFLCSRYVKKDMPDCHNSPKTALAQGSFPARPLGELRQNAMIRAISMIVFWLLAVLAAFCAGITFLAFSSGNAFNQYGYAPADLAVTVALAIPAVFLWRRLRR
jgi:hypothetical protein